MERLTIRNSDGSVSQPTNLNWAEALEKLARYEDAEEKGRLLVLDDATVLALAAGARAMENNPRLSGTSYVWDFLGKHGGPKEISYYAAAQRLRKITGPIVEGWGS